MVSALPPWSTTAINLADHADNPIHTDAGARAAGFDKALVAGTTIYAYLTHPASTAWGLDWVSGGGGELRLRQPVFDQDRVDCEISVNDGLTRISADVDGKTCAWFDVWEQAPAPTLRDGDPLKPVTITINDRKASYGQRCGDDQELYGQHGIAHPVLWANLANKVFKDNLVTGPWIHVRSRIFHQGLGALGATVRVESNLVDKFDSRAGERALVDMAMFADDVPVATIEHEAIITLAS